MNKILSLVVFVLVSMFVLTSCEDEDYSAVLPHYQDVVFSNEGTAVAYNAVPVGKKINVTLVQDKKGKNIYRYDYTWTCSPSVSDLGLTKRGYTSTVDDSNSFTATTPGEYKLTIKVTYNYSGNHGPGRTDDYSFSAGSVSYAIGGDLYGSATITKTFIVK